MNKCRESVSVCSSIFLLPPQSPDRAIALLEIIFDIMGKVEVTRYKSFRRPLLPLEMAMPPLPFFPYSCLKCLCTFPMWIRSLRPWSFLPALNLSPSGMRALLESSLYLLFWGLQAGSNHPHSSQHIPQACYSLTLLISTFFFFSLLNISKEKSIFFRYFPYNPLVSLTLDRLWVALYTHCFPGAVSLFLNSRVTAFSPVS